MGQSREYSIGQRATCCLALLALLWTVELVRSVSGWDFHSWGILPRTQPGLRGVLFAPYIHLDSRHLMLNSGPLLVLAWLVMTHGPWNFLRVTLMIQLMGGLAVWALGRSSYHVGASGLVLGYFGYLVASAVLRRSWTSFFVAALAVLLYGGLLVSVIPGNSMASWEMHLGGLLAGGLAAWASNGTNE
jgi:membrane associated rhomboid family serine protease